MNLHSSSHSPSTSGVSKVIVLTLVRNTDDLYNIQSPGKVWSEVLQRCDPRLIQFGKVWSHVLDHLW